MRYTVKIKKKTAKGLVYAVEEVRRIKASMYLSSTDLPETGTKVASLIQKMVKGDRYLLSDQIITRASTFPMKIFLTWKKEYDEPLVVATTSHNPDFQAEFTIEGKCKKRHYKSNNKLAYFFV